MSSSIPHRGRFFSLLIAVSTAGVGWLSWTNFEAERRYVDVVSLATSLQHKFPTDGQVIGEHGREALTMVDADECRSDLLSAGLTVILTDLDINSSKRTSNEQTASLKSSDRFISHILACTPTDGDAWARLAMIRQALGYSGRDIAYLLEKSASYAPSEGPTIAARLQVWRQAADETLTSAKPAFDRDIFVALNYYSLQDAARTLAGGTQEFRSAVSKAASLLPAQRVASLRRQGLEISSLRAEETGLTH